MRRGHFLGTKLRSLRKRNGLTLEELSVRCIQRDPASAPSVSYLSMIESGKRMPSPGLLELLAGVFQRPPAWFLDESAEPEPVAAGAAAGGSGAGGSAATAVCASAGAAPRMERWISRCASRTMRPASAGL